MDVPAGKTNAKRVNKPMSSRLLLSSLMGMFGGLPRGIQEAAEGSNYRNGHKGSKAPRLTTALQRVRHKLNKRNRQHGIRTRVRNR